MILKEDCLLLLQSCLMSQRPDLLWYIDENVRLTNAIIEELREAVVDELVEKGLNQKDEPNKLGLKLEELINQLRACYM